MSTYFQGEGNLGKDPILNFRPVPGETQPKPVAHFSVFFDRPIVGDDGVKRDERGYWLPVSIWGRRGEMAAKYLRKGARVHVQGTIEQRSWPDGDTGEERSQMQLTASYWALDPIGIDSVTLKAKRSVNDVAASSSLADETAEPSRSELAELI